MLIINHLVLAIGDRVLASDITAKWPRGSLVGVLGPNGCGKSTLLNTISGVGLLTPDHIFFDDQDLNQIRPLARAQHIASVAQYDEADLETVAKDRIAHGLYARKKGKGLTSSQETDLISNIAKAFYIDDLLLRPLSSLSGGQRKKVHLCRALVDDLADIYVIDEPDANLDMDSKENLMQVLKSFSRKDKIVIVSLHDQVLAEKYCNYQLEIGPNLEPTK